MDEKFVIATPWEIFIADLLDVLHFLLIAVPVLLFIALTIYSMVRYPTEWFGPY